MELSEACVSSVLRVFSEGRRGANFFFYIIGDLNVELEMMCTDENDIEELNEMYGASVLAKVCLRSWMLQKFMWYSIVKEFNCKVSSMWSDDHRTKDAAFTHRKHGDGGEEKVPRPS